MSIDGQWGHGGQRRESWIKKRNHYRGHAPNPGGSEVPQLGLVIYNYPKDATDNRFGSYEEYDLFLPHSGVVIEHVPVKSMKRNPNSGTEFTLTPALSAPTITDETQDMWDAVMGSDGDLVVVEWVSRRWPVITGCLNHIRSGQDTADWHAWETDGEVAAVHHSDTHVKIDQEGNASVVIGSGLGIKSFSVTIDGTEIFNLRKDGTHKISLGNAATCLEAVILGTSYRLQEVLYQGGLYDLLLAFFTALNGAANLAAVITAGNVAMTNMPIHVIPADYRTDITKWLSQKTTTEET